MTAAAVTKQRLRADFLAQRRELGPRLRQAAGHRLRRVGGTLPELAGARAVAAYWPVTQEPDVAPLLLALHAAGVRVLLPLGTGAWATFDGRLQPGRWGLSEPLGPAADLTAADVLLAPALAVDRAGTRLGRGGGFYDRALARAPRLRAYAVVYDAEVVAELPVEPHDRRVRGALTPSGVLVFG